MPTIHRCTLVGLNRKRFLSLIVPIEPTLRMNLPTQTRLYLMLISFSFFSSPGEACDFDLKDNTDQVMTPSGRIISDPCVLWERPEASDGTPGFQVINGYTIATIRNNERLSRNPGPTYDATKGTRQGSYAFIRSRTHPPNTVAEIKSPWYGSSGPRCNLTFAINIFGTDVGSLMVFLQSGPNNQSGGSISRSLWQVMGDKGRSWGNYGVEIGQMHRPFRVIFRAIRGSGDDGYIALDDISLEYCHPDLPIRRTCALKEFMCDTQICIPRDKVCDFQKDCLRGEDEDPELCASIPAIGRCNFEEGYCGWRNSTPNSMQNKPPRSFFPWIRHKGSTPNENSGPSKDHTRNTDSGYYIYSAKPKERDLPLYHIDYYIEMPLLPPPPPQTWDENSPFYSMCRVRFFYHMWGNHIISLHVYKEVMGNPAGTEMERKDLGGGTRPKYQGSNAWLRKSLAIGKAKTPYRLRFRALCGPRLRNSDVAVDDVSLSPECFGLGIVNITNNGTAYIMERLKPAWGREVVDPEKDDRCHKMGSFISTFRRNGQEQCMWDAKDLMGIQQTTTSSDFETITEVMNQTARFLFRTCGNSGPSGPSQFQCDAAYRATELADDKVNVIEDGYLRGVQVWEVPETRIYSITALGASGGAGLQNSEQSRGAYANAKFNLTKDEKIYMLVGQMGQSACAQVNKDNERMKEICTKGLFESSDGHRAGGGGGGGGGTFVFKKDPDTGELKPLVVAGGGGGKSYTLGHDPVRADGGLSPTGSGFPGVTPPNGPGAGGGWEGTRLNRTQGSPLALGGEGGEPCKDALDIYDWRIYGGYGGGGGGCTAGGGGGGYSGGNVSQADGAEHNGQGGSSYISPFGIKPVFEPGTSEGHGEVEIAIIFPCACEFMCIYYNYAEKNFKCYCPANHILAEDGLSCINTKGLPEYKAPMTTIIGFSVGGAVIFLVITILIIYALWARANRRPPVTRLDMLTNADYQLDRLRSQIGGQGIMSEYNPNYDFGGTKCTLEDLREIPRVNLTLVRGLGQGAFGEVYQGFLANEPRESREVPVAVKTLPDLSSEQAEMDFLMEALIMSKFQHPNIVRFIGVCFEKHPRFIILELLEGGDLKTFLRESRPKPDQPSRVTMVDLVKLSLDVAKGCKYLEENHFIHRDIAARNCLLTSKDPDRVAKIADFGMARDIYRADYYRKGGKAMLPVKWMPPEAFLDGIFTSKTDVWSFGILLWEVFSLGYMPYPGRGNQEVMQLVTAGGRLEPPENCPSPVYYIMSLCWHGITDRRPNFVNIIERLDGCLQNPQVIHSPLPVFRRPPSIERDTTIMRPRDPDRMVLSVEPPIKYLEPDSPSSLDQLIGPQSPDIHVQLMQKRPNLRASAESMDELLRQEGAAGHEEKPGCGMVPGVNMKQGSFSYQRVFDYDLSMDNGSNQRLEAREVVDGAHSAAAQGAETVNEKRDADAIIVRGDGGSHRANASLGASAYAVPLISGCQTSPMVSIGEGRVPTLGVTVVGGTSTDDSTGDSGKSSLDNMSQTDSASQVSGNSSNGCLAPGSMLSGRDSSKTFSTGQNLHRHPPSSSIGQSVTNAIKNNMTQKENTEWSSQPLNHCGDTVMDNPMQPAESMLTSESPSLRNNPTYPALLPNVFPQNANSSANKTTGGIGVVPHSEYDGVTTLTNPWERRLPQQLEKNHAFPLHDHSLQKQQLQQQPNEKQNEKLGSTQTSSSPISSTINAQKYVNIDVSNEGNNSFNKSSGGEPRKRRSAGQFADQTEVVSGSGTSGAGASSHERIHDSGCYLQTSTPSSYRPLISNMAETRRDEEASKDPGDSGVVIDFKDNTKKRNHTKSQTWL